MLAQGARRAAQSNDVRKPSRGLLPGPPGPPVEGPEYDEAVGVANELLRFGARVFEGRADVVPELGRLGGAVVGPALGRRRGEDGRGVGREGVKERWIPF